jgi:hypothetical protein
VARFAAARRQTDRVETGARRPVSQAPFGDLCPSGRYT